ncbi:MAG TPA: hypothetical protein ENN12_03770 [Epsilonproteobacteria bacterium]|nr:hypothetical protein [Campylobacterota bacterium]
MSSTSTKDIHFFLSSVGGSGKSAISLVSAETLNAKIYDAHIGREFISDFSGINTFSTTPPETDGSLFSFIDNILRHIIGEHFDNGELTDTEKTPVVVDLDPALTFAFLRYVENTDFAHSFETFVGSGKCYFHFIFSPETAVRSGNDIDLFHKRAELFSDKSVILWINEYKDTFLNETERENLKKVVEEKFRQKFLGTFHIAKNEAIKRLYRERIYEPKMGIYKAYEEANIFEKGKLRAYGNHVAKFLEECGFNTKRLDPSAAATPKYKSSNIADEVKEMKQSESIFLQQKKEKEKEKTTSLHSDLAGKKEESTTAVVDQESKKVDQENGGAYSHEKALEIEEIDDIDASEIEILTLSKEDSFTKTNMAEEEEEEWNDEYEEEEYYDEDVYESDER